MRRLAFTSTMVLACSAWASAQDWRGIQPIRSTCRDVQSIFGEDTCSKGSVSRVFSDETVVVVFAEGGCKASSRDRDYDVPAGTVTDIVVMPRYPKRLFISDLRVDRSKFKRKPDGDLLGSFVYTSLELGMKFTVSQSGRINDITYFPGARYNRLHCASKLK